MSRSLNVWRRYLIGQEIDGEGRTTIGGADADDAGVDKAQGDGPFVHITRHPEDEMLAGVLVEPDD